MAQDTYVDPEKLKYDNFDARSYLERYYNIPPFEGALKQIVKFYSSFPDDSLTVLNYAGGPTLDLLIFAADKAREYVQADYAPSSITEVSSWIRNDPGAFDWKFYTKHCLQLEGKAGSKQEVEIRERRMRSVFKAAVFCDILTESNEVIDCAYKGPYDVVHCIGCLTLCPTYAAFTAAVRKLSALVNNGGFLHVEMGMDTHSYTVGDTVYAKRLHVTKESVIDALRLAGITQTLVYEYTEVNESAGYMDQILMFFGQKARPTI